MTASAHFRTSGGKSACQRRDWDRPGPRPHDGRIKEREVRCGRGVGDQWVTGTICDVQHYCAHREKAELSDRAPLSTMCARNS